MTSSNDSKERIAADILIAWMESNKTGEERQYVSTPEKIAETYQTIYHSVFWATKKAQPER